ncbi:MAG TPA: extracellular solute-binding protein, partial [Stellaceae bacterium]|nr:extracellular solute-binding protein [Stellaceae bacterium]
YPGKRAMFKYFQGTGEQILLGDGVAPDQIYPLDMKRVIAKAKSLGKDFFLWDSGAASQQMFLDGEVVMASIWHTRAYLLKRDTKGRIDFTWIEGLRCPGAWVIPKGVKDVKLCNQFIASTLDPARQVKLLDLLGNGPSNPRGSQLASGEITAKDPSNAANLKLQITRDEDWYARFGDDALDQWLDGMSG